MQLRSQRRAGWSFINTATLKQIDPADSNARSFDFRALDMSSAAAGRRHSSRILVRNN